MRVGEGRFHVKHSFFRGISPPRRQDLFPLFCRARRYAGFRTAGRVSFPAMGKKPKDRRGTPQRRTPFANDGLPLGPHLRGPQLGDQGSQRKGAGGSAEWFPFYDRCHFVVAKSAQLRFRLTAKTTLAPLLLLSNANPLRWALRWISGTGVSAFAPSCQRILGSL